MGAVTQVQILDECLYFTLHNNFGTSNLLNSTKKLTLCHILLMQNVNSYRYTCVCVYTQREREREEREGERERHI